MPTKMPSSFCFVLLICSGLLLTSLHAQALNKYKKVLIVTSSVTLLAAIGIGAKILVDRKRNKSKGIEGEFSGEMVPKRVILIGDSTLDNAFWNDVEKDTTGEVLQKLLAEQGIIVDDRSAEEASTETVYQAIKNNERVIIDSRYAEKRDTLGIPYDSDGAGSSRFKKYHHRQADGQVQVDVTSDIKGSIVFISLGGNDVGLIHNLNPYRICNNLAKLAKFYKEQGAVGVYYIYPYSPTMRMARGSKLAYRGLTFLHKYMNPALEKTVKHSAFDGFIDLSDFADEHRGGPGIPEPTKLGAKIIAERIAQRVISSTNK
jgi:hypothetical protein